MTQETSRFYNVLAPVYPVFDLFLGAPKKIMIRRINTEQPGRLLEIGVGRGDTLGSYDHKPLTGIDTSEGLLAFARKNAPADCSLHVMDAGQLGFEDGAFDYAVLSYVLSVTPHPMQVLAEVHRVLSPQGRVFILNHVSTGKLRQRLNRVIAPLTRLLHFSAVFDVEAHVDQDKFAILEHKRCAILPNITLYVLEKR